MRQKFCGKRAKRQVVSGVLKALKIILNTLLQSSKKSKKVKCFI
jgi:hypothetical protein